MLTDTALLNQVTCFILGAAAGCIVTLSLAYRRVGRVFARILAIAALAAGAGLLTWALDAALRSEELRAIAWQPIVISTSSEAFGWAAGCLLGGALALGLSFVGRSD